MEIKDLLIYIYIWHVNYTNQLMLTARVLSLSLTDIYFYASATIGRGTYCFTPVRPSVRHTQYAQFIRLTPPTVLELQL